MKRMKPILSLMLICTIVGLLLSPVNSYAKEAGKDELTELIDRTGIVYYEMLDNNYSIEEAQQYAIDQFLSGGYTECYAVTATNYKSIEDELNTDLSKLGIQEGDHCVIVISTDELPSKNTRETISGEFSYSYGSQTYTLRYVTVTYADNSLYQAHDSADLLHSTVSSTIHAYLYQAVAFLISGISQGAGLLYSLCGSVATAVYNSTNVRMDLYAHANWTRVFTQVLNGYNGWQTGSRVEYATTFVRVEGDYYNVTNNRFEDLPDSRQWNTTYSSHYNDNPWRNSHAVMGYLNSYVDIDITGTIRITHNGSTKLTLYETF